MLEQRARLVRFEDSAPRKSEEPSMGSCTNALRFCVFFFNLVFWIAGIIILGLGLWIVADPTASDFFALHATHQGSFRIVAFLLIGAGILMTLIGCLGCWGAWNYNQCALAMFCIVLVLVFCLELAAAVIAYNKQENIRQYVESSMYDTIRNRYASESAYKSAMDSIQHELECCGVKNYGDWLGASWDRKTVEKDDDNLSKLEHGIGAVGGGRGNGYGRVPASCCNAHGMETYPTNCGISFTKAPLHTYEQFMHTSGCGDALYNKIYLHLDIVIGVCIVIGAIQLVGMVISMVLCCCLNAEKRSYDY